MLKFVFLKLLNKKWMVLALLIGNILLISVAGAGAMYADASLQRSLNQNFRDYLSEKNRHPCMIQITSDYPTSQAAMTITAAKNTRKMPETMGVPASMIVEHYFTDELNFSALLEREHGMDTTIAIGTMTELEDHIEIVSGQMYSTQPDENGIVDVIVSEKGFMEMNLLLNECFSSKKITNENNEPIVFRVCGVFRANSTSDAYWVDAPSTLTDECLMDDALFHAICTAGGKLKLNGKFSVMLDYSSISIEQVPDLLAIAEETYAYYDTLAKLNYLDTFRFTLSDYLAAEKLVTLALWVLQVPMFVLLAAFLFMVSRQMLDMEQNEIAVLKSRGASRMQIICVYLIQSLLITLVSLMIGIPLGAFLVQVLGSANEFLEFVGRSALPLEFSNTVFLFCGTAVLVSVCAMVLPVFRHANVTIVNHMQKKHRKRNTPLWQKLFLDVIILGVALYGLYTFNGQKDSLTAAVLNGEPMNPLLFICSSLFMLGAALLALRLIPAITYVIFRLFRRWWSPSLYATFLQLIRNRQSQSFIVVFLIMTMALGVFNSQTARTVNTSSRENTCYTIGADIVLQEKWKDNSEKVRLGLEQTLVYTEPAFDRYTALVGNGATNVTKVLRDNNVNVRLNGSMTGGVNVMAIDPSTFGPIAWTKDGLLKHHLYEYLNAMITHDTGVLISRNFQIDMNLQLGDTFAYYHGTNETARGIVCGIVDYWPGYNPVRYEANANGSYDEYPNYLIVANINYIHKDSDWPLRPYEVWIDAENDTDFIYDFIEEKQITLKSFKDTSDQLIRLKNDPLFQGSNGVLTVSFVVVLILCSVGFLIYWILSIRSRSLQFGIYRAMGMSMGEVLLMLFGEQLFISGTSIGTGIWVGGLAAKLYIPLIQIAYTNADSALPLELVSDSSDTLRLLIVVGIVMLICMVILGWLVSKLKITQALKLGED